jgi:hypothetical protein
MIKCIVIIVIIFLVLLLINSESCENYTNFGMSNYVPCYDAIKYEELEKSRYYNANDVNYNDSNDNENYDFSNENVSLSNSVLPMPSM